MLVRCACVCLCICMCVCECVWVRQREGEGESEKETDRKSLTESENDPAWGSLGFSTSSVFLEKFYYHFFKYFISQILSFPSVTINVNLIVCLTGFWHRKLALISSHFFGTSLSLKFHFYWIFILFYFLLQTHPTHVFHKSAGFVDNVVFHVLVVITAHLLLHKS